MLVFEKSRHIAEQLRNCNWRIKELSDSYHRNLVASLKSKRFAKGKRMAGCFSELIFYSSHSAFSELSSLRDHLAMFVGRVLLGMPATKCDSWASLVRENKFQNSAHPIVTQIKASTWANTFGEYRNLIVHNAPLSQAHGRVMVSHETMEGQMGSFPAVALRLPANPSEIRLRFRKGHTYKNYKEWVDTIADASKDGPDTLAYCHSAFGDFLRLAHAIASYSPIEPKMFQITDADVIGEPTVEEVIIPPLSIPLPKS
jgi:hypothetical protein